MADVIQIRETVKLDFFREVDTDPEWQLVDMEFIAEKQIIVNKGGTTVEFSYDGRQIHGVLDEGEHITFDDRMRRQIWFRSPNGEGLVRLSAWSNP